jgi:hypothetical protein
LDVEGTTGVTTFRVSSKDRKFVDEVHYKGWAVKLADWVHLSNPDDPSRPIIAQVFRVWVSEEPWVLFLVSLWFFGNPDGIWTGQRRVSRV